MKIAVKYEVVVHDDAGNVLADAQAALNVSDIQTLVKTVVNTMTGVMSAIDEVENTRAAGAAEFNEILSRAKAGATQES